MPTEVRQMILLLLVYPVQTLYFKISLLSLAGLDHQIYQQ